MRVQTEDAQRELQGCPERGTEGVLGWGWGRGGATEGKRWGGQGGTAELRVSIPFSSVSPQSVLYCGVGFVRAATNCWNSVKIGRKNGCQRGLAIWIT